MAQESEQNLIWLQVLVPPEDLAEELARLVWSAALPHWPRFQYTWLSKRLLIESLLFLLHIVHLTPLQMFLTSVITHLFIGTNQFFLVWVISVSTGIYNVKEMSLCAHTMISPIMRSAVTSNALIFRNRVSQRQEEKKSGRTLAAFWVLENERLLNRIHHGVFS